MVWQNFLVLVAHVTTHIYIWNRNDELRSRFMSISGVLAGARHYARARARPGACCRAALSPPPGPTHRDMPPCPCLPAAPGRSSSCYVRAGLSCLPKHRRRPNSAAEQTYIIKYIFSVKNKKIAKTEQIKQTSNNKRKLIRCNSRTRCCSCIAAMAS